MRHFILAILIFLPASQTLTANNASEGELQTITEKVSGLKKYDGFLLSTGLRGKGKYTWKWTGGAGIFWR